MSRRSEKFSVFRKMVRWLAEKILKTLIDLYAEQEGVTITYELEDMTWK